MPKIDELKRSTKVLMFDQYGTVVHHLHVVAERGQIVLQQAAQLLVVFDQQQAGRIHALRLHCKTVQPRCGDFYHRFTKKPGLPKRALTGLSSHRAGGRYEIPLPGGHHHGHERRHRDGLQQLQRGLRQPDRADDRIDIGQVHTPHGSDSGFFSNGRFVPPVLL